MADRALRSSLLFVLITLGWSGCTDDSCRRTFTCPGTMSPGEQDAGTAAGGSGGGDGEGGTSGDEGMGGQAGNAATGGTNPNPPDSGPGQIGMGGAPGTGGTPPGSGGTPPGSGGTPEGNGDCEGCLIGGVCYDDQVENPEGTCEVCDATLNSAGWSPLGCVVGSVCYADGAPNPENPCEFCDVSVNVGAFSGTGCQIDSVCYAPDAVNPDNPCERCDPVGSAEAWTASAGCAIGDTCFTDGMVNPGNPCEVCDASAATDAWTNRAGVSCNDDLYCTISDACAGGVCSGQPRVCTDNVACTVGDSCDEDEDECVPGPVDCAAGESCDAVSGTCSGNCAGCMINDVCYPVDALNSSNSCETCAPGTSSTAWSPLAGGSECDDGLACTENDVCAAGECVGEDLQCDDGLYCSGNESCSEPTGCVDGPPPCSGASPVCSESMQACGPEDAPPTLGFPCASPGTVVCVGPAQNSRLVCSDDEWMLDTPCPNGQHCDQSDGTCAPVIPECNGNGEGHTFCEAPDVLHTCGPDEISTESMVCDGVCTANACQDPICGDSKLQADEECDDANDEAADGCEPGDCIESQVLSLGLGDAHTCALLRGGYVRCWGANNLGQLGLGHTAFMADRHPWEVTDAGGATGPIDLGGSAVSLAVGDDFACTLLDDDTVRCWGGNTGGELGLGHLDAVSTQTPAQMGAVDVGGAVTAIAAAGRNACALLQGGTVRCWGSNLFGRLGIGNTTDVSATLTPAEFDQDSQIELPLPAIAIATGGFGSCAQLQGGSVRCWGTNTSGALGFGDSTAPNNQIGNDEEVSAGQPVLVPLGRTVTQISAGSTHVCLRLDNGWLECFGSNTFGRLGLGHTSAIGDNESPATFGTINFTPLMASSVSAGVHTCTLLSGGGARCWGLNTSAQLGYPNVSDVSTTAAVDLPTIQFGTGLATTAIHAGNTHTCALLGDGQVRCWGLNLEGELGLGFVGDGTAGGLDYVGGAATSTPDLLPSVQVFPPDP